MNIRIGTSGWVYPHWRGVFYPEELPQKKWLEFYSQHFDTLELNSSFYHLPKLKTFENWAERTPVDFIWSVKASRFITHIKKLSDPYESLDKFLNAIKGLKQKLGPVLFQLPPSLKYNQKKFELFLKALPKKYLYVFEVRHPSWICDEFKKQLTRYNASFCIADTAGRFPFVEFITADFVYIRLHGSKILYGSKYSKEELKSWAKKIKKWKKDTFVYFDNDFKAYAVENAVYLKKILL